MTAAAFEPLYRTDSAETTEDLSDDSEDSHKARLNMEEFVELTDCIHKGSSSASNWLRSIVVSQSFTAFVSIVIILNLFSLIIQADFGENKHLWRWVNLGFLGLFTLELVLRMCVRGFWVFFFSSPEVFWNHYDFWIVTVGIMDVLLRVWRLGNRHGLLIFLARTLRILRVLRVLRLLRTFRQLRMLARGLLESVTIVFWIFFLIVFLIYIYAIMITEVIHHSIEAWEGNDRDEVQKYFGNVLLSMFTLFQIVTLDGWVKIDKLITKKMPLMQIWFFSFIIIASFVILSLLTGVMADHMDQVRKDEEAELRRLNRENYNQEANTQETFQRIFKKDGDGAWVDKKEFRTIFAKPTVAAELDADDIDLDGMSAQEIFDMFDKNGDGKLVWSEFRSGIAAYRDGLTSLQLIKIKSLLRALENQIRRPCAKNAQLLGQSPVPSATAEKALADAETRLTDLDMKLSDFDDRVREMMRLYRAVHHFNSPRGSLSPRRSTLSSPSSLRSSPGSPGSPAGA